MTAAELRALLRAHPEAALEAMADVKIAGPWVEHRFFARWARLQATDGVTVHEDENNGRYIVLSAGKIELGTYDTLAEAQAAADAHLLAEGWVLVDGDKR